MSKSKLELTWIGKDQRPKLEPRILLEDPSLSYHATKRVTDQDQFDNRLIFGDNLLALKALEQEFTGKIKCIYIDPPYNTGSAFEHYEDGVEHSIWLSLVRDRIELLWKMLSMEGSLWVNIDDNEMAYLRVLMDEVCGRTCFIAQNIWQKRYSRDNNSAIGDVHDYIICYAKNPEIFKAIRNRVEPDEKSRSYYKNPNNDPKGPWRLIPMNGAELRPNQQYPVKTPSGKIVFPPEGRHWSVLEPKMKELIADGRVYFGKDGSSQPNLIRYLSEVEGLVPWTWWPHEEVGHTDEAKKEIHSLFGKVAAFATPKPERLISRIIHIATNKDDWVLDSFAGSGTTGAVAHKMGRRWIMVELGEHCQTHIIPRLRKVIDGDDPGGVTEQSGWQGGGGFRYFRLASSLLEKDTFGNWVISREYNPTMLAEAMCKLEGFRFHPSDALYWQHGHATENDFIYVTTQSLSREQLAQLSEQVGPNRSLLVMCGAFRARDLSAFPNLTVKKIPKTVLDRCEWGRDDYSLAINKLPAPEVTAPSEAAPTAGATDAEPSSRTTRKARAKKQYRSLFEEGEK
jgi:adenine-specific DNA-methyltransferase